MFINPRDATVYMKFNWWVDQLFVGLRNRPVLKATRLAKMVKEAQIHRERMLDVSSIHDIAFCS